MCPRPCSSSSIREAQYRAVSTISSRPAPAANVSIAGPVDVAGGRPRDVGDDVLLELPGADRHELAGAIACASRRDVSAGCGRTPTETGRRRGPGCGRPRERRRETPDAVLEHRPRRFGVGRGEERQDEHVAVPEHVPAVRAVRSVRERRPPPRLRPARGDQMEQREPDGELELGVAFDHARRRPPTRSAHARRCSASSASNPSVRARWTRSSAACSSATPCAAPSYPATRSRTLSWVVPWMRSCAAAAIDPGAPRPAPNSPPRTGLRDTRLRAAALVVAMGACGRLGPAP